eukprot:scaffold46872_cov21-Tisochrysis_lutea.AAC.1
MHGLVLHRACKADLRLLPPLHVRVTRLNFAPEHAQSYNDLVEVGSRLASPWALIHNMFWSHFHALGAILVAHSSSQPYATSELKCRVTGYVGVYQANQCTCLTNCTGIISPGHVQSAPFVPQVVRRNMLLADWHDEDHKESLMNEKQGKWAQEMIKNVRLSCCVAGEGDAVGLAVLKISVGSRAFDQLEDAAKRLRSKVSYWQRLCLTCFCAAALFAS